MAEHKSQKLAERCGICPGARWTEENVGSTGLSIALRTRTAMAISGNEHYCLALRGWDCSACPIFVDGVYIGTFDVCRPYTAINCAPLPRELISTELFGYEGGAFTGAKLKGNQGKIEASNKGTI
jgi:transcriptional regulator of acetoin/glycerol metabolism